MSHSLHQLVSNRVCWGCKTKAMSCVGVTVECVTSSIHSDRKKINPFKGIVRPFSGNSKFVLILLYRPESGAGSSHLTLGKKQLIPKTFPQFIFVHWFNRKMDTKNHHMSCTVLSHCLLIRTLLYWCSPSAEAQPVYIGVPATHRRKRRRHHSCASDADRDSRHTHYDHHTHREQPHRGYYHDGEEHYDEDDEGGAEHLEHVDPSGLKTHVTM